jgi:hypothetical protein
VATTQPILGLNSWLLSTEKLVEYIFSYYCLTDHSQDHVFRNNVPSLKYTLHEFHRDPSSLMAEIRRELETLFAGHFETVTVEVNERGQAQNDGTPYLLIGIGVMVKDKTGREVGLNKVARIEGSLIQQIADAT